jgi:glucose-6-phosphate isomerase
VLKLQGKIVGYLKSNPGQKLTVDAIASGIGEPNEIETVFKILQHLSANPHHGVKRQSAASPFEATYSLTAA